MKIPFLHNVRRGLATNSSSSHSLVFHAQPVASDDISVAGYDSEYGWGNFVLDTLGEKLMYALTSAVGRGWQSNDNAGRANEIKEAREKYGYLFPEFQDDAIWSAAIGGYVDHQSLESDIESLVAKVRDPHVIIEGGNDNEGWYGDPPVPLGGHREDLGRW